MVPRRYEKSERSAGIVPAFLPPFYVSFIYRNLKTQKAPPIVTRLIPLKMSIAE